MPLAIESVLGYASLSGTGQNALTAGANQSFTVRNFTNGKAYLEDVYAVDSVGAFTAEIKSPKMHDTTYGLQFAATPKSLAGTSIFNPVTLLPGFVRQQLYATDSLTVSMAGANADVVLMLMNMYYEDLSGIAARLYTWQTIEPLIVNLAGVTVTPETSGTAGAWGTTAAFNSGNYNLKANTDYAILGYQTQLPCGAIVIQGTDTGNLPIGGPGSTDTYNNGWFFVDQAVKYQKPHIPVINSNNAPGITVNVAGSGTSANILVSFTVAQLSQNLPSPGAGV